MVLERAGIQINKKILVREKKEKIRVGDVVWLDKLSIIDGTI